MKVTSDHRSKFSNLSNWEEEAWKNQGFNEIRTRDLCEYRCDALPTELWSHTLGARSIYWVHIFPCSEMMWSLYEIIHICTAVVDESEEWSSRYVALNCCHHLARALALFLLATYQNLPYSALRYLIPPYQGDEPNSSFLLYVQGEHQDSENIIGTFRNISGRLFIRRIISLEEKFSSPWDCRCRSIQKSRFFCTLCPCRWGRIGKALTWKKLACA